MTYKQMDTKTKIQSNKFEIGINRDLTKILSETYIENPTMDNFNKFISHITKNTNEILIDEFLNNERERFKELKNQ
jgi:hypothetical protein